MPSPVVLKPLNNYLAPMFAASVIVIIFITTGFIQLPSSSSSLMSSQTQTAIDLLGSRKKETFSDVGDALDRWDKQVGCKKFREKNQKRNTNASSIAVDDHQCLDTTEHHHVNVLVKSWTWIPDSMDGMYACKCGITCLWTKQNILADKPQAMLYEGTTPPINREETDPFRVYMDLEASRSRTGNEDIFIGYHAKDDVQATYAGNVFHKNRNYNVSPQKRSDILVYWSSSRCLPQRNQLAKSFLSLIPYHSFGKCLNNVGGDNVGLSLYPECSMNEKSVPQWWDHLHCVMSHYKFVLAIENTKTESYVTEKLYYALDAGAVPIYFGAPNVWDFIPPSSIIDGSKFSSMEELAVYVKTLAEDPIAYAEYHAWRRCGVIGNYGKTRAASLDTVPCRLCELISRKGWKSTKTL